MALSHDHPPRMSLGVHARLPDQAFLTLASSLPSTPFRRTRLRTSPQLLPAPTPAVALHQVVASSARNLFTKISWRRMTAAERSASEGRLGDEAAALAGNPGAPTTDATRWP